MQAEAVQAAEKPYNQEKTAVVYYAFLLRIIGLIVKITGRIHYLRRVMMVVGRPFLTVEQIQNRNRELADRISADYQGRDLLALGILKGAFIFFSDLVRLIQVPLTIDFIIASSYLKSETSGEIKLHYDAREEIADKDVLLIEDIIDTGISMNYIRERILNREPRSLKICTFLDKKGRREVDLPLDYVGFEAPNEFVVGYGLDYDNRYRNLPYVSIFRKTT